MAGEAKQVTLTKGTRLYYRKGEATAWEIMARIKDYPGMRSAPERVDTTDLSDEMHTYIPGLPDAPELTFNIHHSKELALEIIGSEGIEHEYAVVFGDDGEYGWYYTKGEHFYSSTEGQVNTPHNAQITLYPSQKVEFMSEAFVGATEPGAGA